MTDPAHFVPFGNGLYLPANRIATDLAKPTGKMYLSEQDLLDFKSGGTRVTYTNGEPIALEVTA